jgi:hypothetical protein
MDYEQCTASQYGYGKHKSNGSMVSITTLASKADKDSNEYSFTAAYGQKYSNKFVGLSSNDLLKFNKKLIETMKGIYVYNPDYDSLNVNIGNALIEDK